MMLCLGTVGARDGMLCPMTGRPMVDHLTKRGAATHAADCAYMADHSMSTSSNRAITPPSNTESKDTRPSHNQWPSCCAGHVLIAGIPSSGPILRAGRLAAITPVQHTPYLATRALTPEPPPPKVAG